MRSNDLLAKLDALSRPPSEFDKIGVMARPPRWHIRRWLLWLRAVELAKASIREEIYLAFVSLAIAADPEGEVADA